MISAQIKVAVKKTSRLTEKTRYFSHEGGGSVCRSEIIVVLNSTVSAPKVKC